VARFNPERIETMTVINRPEQIEAFRLLTLRQALMLEMKGMRRTGKSAYSILREMGYSGTRAEVLEQLDKIRAQLLAE
jgi:hypothetical protein